MNLHMTGLEHSSAPLAQRERLSFSRSAVAEICRKIRSAPGITGCVLLATCNRTELYFTGQPEENVADLIWKAAGMDPVPVIFTELSDQEALRHLMEVAAGLCSRIWGEDQIIRQVKSAIDLAREAGTADSLLETLFRTAIAAGKEIRSEVRLTDVPVSAPSAAVTKIEKLLGSLQGKSAVVIGNGEMGRLSAGLLRDAGCRVSVTLRTYRHGETVVPSGCDAVPYDRRFSAIDGADILFSATASPHYTILARDVSAMKNPPSIMVDLAVPRDIEPDTAHIPGVMLLNIDDLGDCRPCRTVPPRVEESMLFHQKNFYRWLHYRQCMSARDSLKDAIIRRILAAHPTENPDTELIIMSVDKTVDLMMGGLAEQITPENLQQCEQKIRAHTH